MSRSGYTDDCENHGLYRGTVARAIRGRRGQQALRDFIAALDAMPEKRLASGSFTTENGVCSLGALAQARGVDVSDLNPPHPEDPWVDKEAVGRRLNIAECMAAEVMYENDEANYYPETAEARWQRMRAWASARLLKVDP